MNAAEREIWASLVSGLIVNAWFLNRIRGMFADGTSTAPDGLQTWAATMLWVVPVAIVGAILATILANILHGIVTRERDPFFLKDERDKTFQLWGLGVTMIVMVLGFLGSMVALAMGTGAFVAFNLIYLAMFLADVAGSLLKITLYRTGA